MGNINLEKNQQGLLGLNRGSLEMGQQDLNDSVRKVKEVISKCQSLRQEAYGIEDGGSELAAKMSTALEAATSLLKELSGVQGYVISKEAGFDEAERKSIEALSKLGIMSGIDDIQFASESYYSQNQERIETIKSSVMAQNEAKVKAEKAAKFREEHPIIGNYVAVAADVTNALVAFGGGAATVVEDLADGVGILATGAATPFTALYDYATGSRVTADMWKSTMSFVAEEHVQNLVKSWYEPGGALSNVDIYAHDVFKSDGVGCQIANGVGYVAATALITYFTMGLGGEAIAISKGAGLAAKTAAKLFTRNATIIGTIAGFGGGTEDYWARQRDSTPKGEDWRTLENLVKGLGYGTATGAWEGLQWYTGTKLAGKTMNPLARVGIDSAFNAGDAPFRAAADAVASGKDFSKAFEEQGGWQAVGTNFAIGLIPSVGGELSGLTKVKPKVKTNLTGENTSINNIVKINTQPAVPNESSRVRVNTQPNVSNETTNIFPGTSSRIRRYVDRR